ncbi:hypothetical protein ABE61_21410, partial [Lysinibacillus sphaericus]|nr:hypothetical protein [Lysinibacillus sphaericus]
MSIENEQEKKSERWILASPVQERIYISDILEPGKTSNNVTTMFTLQGNIDEEKLLDSLNQTININELLRAEFRYEAGKLEYHITDKKINIELIRFDSDLNLDECKKKALDGFVRPFNMVGDTLCRVRVVFLNNQIAITLLDCHHSIFDGNSVSVFAKDLQCYYENKFIEKKEAYETFSEWQWKNVKSDEYYEKKDYWKEMFSEPAQISDFWWSNNGVNLKVDSHSSEEKIVLSRKNIAELCKERGITEYSFFVSAISLAFGRLTSQKDVTIGTVASGRIQNYTKDMIGMFVNTFPVRNLIEENDTITEYLSKVHQNVRQSLKNSDVQYNEICEIANASNDKPPFQVALRFQDSFENVLELEKISCMTEEILPIDNIFDFQIMVNRCSERYDVLISYSNGIYEKDTVLIFLKYLTLVIDNMVDNFNNKLESIPLIVAEDYQKVLFDFIAAKTDYPKEKTVVELFEEQVAKTPDQIALVFEGEEVSYRVLNERANVLAHKLRELGVKPDDFVAIMAERSIEMIAGIYGIIKAGAAYVPIDPTYPEERIAFMLEDCQPKAMLLYQAEYETNLSKIDLKEVGIWEGNIQNPEKVNKAEDLIYCIYTSGTTGTPKGTLLEHRGVVSLKYMFERNLEITPADNIIQFANFIFDASVWEMTMALLNGATLVCMPAIVGQNPKEFSEYCKNNRVTVATLPPNYYLQKEVDVEFRKLITAGSESSMALIKKVGDSSYINAYGPTETTVCASYWEKEENWDTTIIPIGKPISNTQIYILNGDNLCGIGVPGELCIAGDGLARGYLNRPELTEEKFVKNPFGEGRLYRSGDLARWLPDGNIEYLGRIDEQVKIRGFRIELGEIESRIREIKGIHDSAVIAKADQNGDQAIYAYYTGESVSVSEIREHLAGVLPEYMIPSYMMEIDSIPVTRNGKLDKSALPEIEVKATREYVAPRNKKESMVCEAFSTMLNVKEVGVKENFFELGGDSIKAIRIISNLRNVGYHLTVKDIMNGKTAERIALVMKEMENERKYEQGEISGSVTKTPIIKLFDSWNLEKPEHFNQAMMFPVDGIDNTQIKQTIEELVKHHDMLRAVYRNQQLEILPISESKLCDFYEFDYRGKDDVKQAIQERCSKIQASINLETGPLVKIAVFETDQDKVMMFCVHHLAIDGVSWRILAEDFETVVDQIQKNEEIRLPEKTASFMEWSKKLEEYGEQLS